MKTLSLKLQIRLACDCGYKFTKIYTESQINTKSDDTHIYKYVFAGCPKCKSIDEIIVEVIKK